MDERKTHYQLSFTARQGLFLFVGLIAALGIAYFLGILTGLTGREKSPGASLAETSLAAAPTNAPGATALAGPAASLPPRLQGPEIAAAAPAPAGTPREIHLFEDGGELEPTAPAVKPAPKAPAVASETLWVQVISSSSEPEARARIRKLSSRGYHAAIETVSGPKGTLYRVRVGPYRSRADATRAAERLSAEEHTRAWIVPQGK